MALANARASSVRAKNNLIFIDKSICQVSQLATKFRNGLSTSNHKYLVPWLTKPKTFSPFNYAMWSQNRLDLGEGPILSCFANWRTKCMRFCVRWPFLDFATIWGAKNIFSHSFFIHLIRGRSNKRYGLWISWVSSRCADAHKCSNSLEYRTSVFFYKII